MTGTPASIPASIPARTSLGGVADEYAVLALGIEAADCGADKVGRWLHQVRVVAVAADDQADVSGEVVPVEVGADRGVGVVADNRDLPADGTGLGR